MKYCGLDLGKRNSHYCIVDDQRRVVREGKTRTREKDLKLNLALDGKMRVVIEASGKSFWVADILKELDHEVVVVDPKRTKAIGSARIKHDRLDARILAELCQANLLARVDIPTRDERLQRLPVKTRNGMVRARAMLMNAVRSTLDGEGVESPPAWAGNFVEQMKTTELAMPPGMYTSVEQTLDAIAGLDKSIAICDESIESVAENDPTMKLLQTVPGVGPICAAAYVHAIRDPGRFRSARQVGAYLGLVPSLYSSGQTHRTGRITKQGNRMARWLLHIAANAMLRSRRETALRRWAKGLEPRLGRKKTITALARKLAGVLWAVWKRGKPFEARLAIGPEPA